MNESSSPPVSRPSPWLVVLGILFILVWLALHVLWAGMAMMANLMANDSGSANPDMHMLLIFGMLAGQVLAGAAGIPAGLAFFVRSKRKLLLWLFVILFVVGALIQGAIFYSFFQSMS